MNRIASTSVLVALLVGGCGGDDAGPPDAAGGLVGDTDTRTDAEDVPSDGHDAEDATDADGDEASPGDADDADADDTDADGSDAADAEVDAPPTPVDADLAFDLANPFMGSGGTGFAYASGTPAAQMPVGLVKVGADTTFAGNHAPQNHFSGYYYTDPHIRGFSHIRLVGTGAADLGNLRFLPLASLDGVDPANPFTARDPAREWADPGYYRIELPDEGVDAEMAATYQGAIHRYAYEGDALLILDPTASILDSGTLGASIAIDGTSVTGSFEYRGGFAGRGGAYTLYFDIEVSPAPTRTQVWQGSELRDGDEFSGTSGGLILGFAPGSTVELRVGVSMLDAEAAAANRAAQVGDASLEAVAEAAAEAWKQVFDNVVVTGGTEAERRTFYSALYNAYRMPSRLSEPDGRYVGFDHAPHTAVGHAYYSDLSLWDTYRTLHPWYSLTDHELQRDCLLSLLLMAEQSGRGAVPRWPSMVGDTGSMIGSSADIVFGDAASKGVAGVDWTRAFEVLHASTWGRTFDEPLETGREGIEDYAALGYLPADRFGSSVSKTLEYAWDDLGLANLARVAGLGEAAATFDRRALNFLELLDPATGFLMPRNADGTFVTGIRPTQVYMGEGPYTEGSAWHWRFYGWWASREYREALEALDVDLGHELEEFFARSPLGRPGPPFITLPDSYYWHGNEPAIHAAHLFHEAGLPDRAAYWVREIQDRLYSDGPTGIPGNDDGGTMSAWYLFTALGLYPVAGSDLYFLNAPIFDRAEVALGDGTTLTVVAPGASTTRRFVQTVTLDGEPVLDGRLRHADLRDATLEFALSDTPPTR